MNGSPITLNLNLGAEPLTLDPALATDSTSPLGQPGLSFRYVGTFGVTEEPYPADVAHLNGPNGMFIDATDSLYVVEERGQRLLKYDDAGVVTLTIGHAAFPFTTMTTLPNPEMLP
jgi:hypothetical protein